MQGLDDLKYSAHGLIPAIIQDVDTSEVLMMAYMNKTSLEKTIQTGKTNFWSRSRQKYWMKGETSGHVQEVQEVFIDCDTDTVLIKVKQKGVACHEGYKNCFFRKYDAKSGQWNVCADRQVNPEDVYGSK
jgi:phosphoribosyl-AMP cyclohydrolase